MRRLVTVGLLWFAAASCGGGDGGGGPAPVDLVTLSGDSTVVIAGTTLLMAAASAGGAPATTGVTFQWSANNGNATVSPSSGVVTGVARGSVTITAEAVQNGTATGVTATRNLRVRIGSLVIPSTPGTLTSIDDTVTLAAQAKDALNATVGGVTIAWSSSNPAAATVNPTTGLVTAVANGTTSVIAAAQGERAADTVTVTVAQVATTLAITPDTTAFTRIGLTLTPSVAATDARGHAVSGGAITWNSTVPAVASVDGAGTITSHDDGTTYVVGASGLLKDSVKVVVGLVYFSVDVATTGGLPARIDTVLFTQVNATRQLGLIVRDSGSTIVPSPQNITWGLKDSVVASISSGGLLTGNTLTGQDSVVVTARTARGTALLIVRQDVASVAITPASAADLNFVGDTQRFAAQAKDGGGANIPGKTYTWSTNDVRLAIDAAGLATAVGRSSATGVVLRVRTLVDGIKDSVNIRVKQVPRFAFLSPNSFSTFTALGQHVAASCVVEDSGGDTIPAHPCTWSTAAPDSGVVSYSPTTAVTTNITARKNGDANVRATAFTNIFAPNVVSVQQAAARVTLHPTTFDTSRVLHDSTMRMIDSVFDANDSLIRSPAPSITWSSTAAFATVDSTGKVTAGASAGTTFIKAVSGTGKDSALVQVTTTPITLSANVQPIFTANCSSCHDGVGGTLPGVQNLTTGNTFAAIVNKAAIESLLKKVLPFVPDSSYLVHKIQGTHLLPPASGSGVRMPFGCSGGSCLSKGMINLIRNWILQGARNN